MDLDPLLLSRIQFGFTVSFHIIFPAFTIGLAAWLATMEGMQLATGNPVYQRLFDFWIKIFAVSFGVGVVSGIVMAFQFGTNWSVLAEKTGPIQGPLLGYETFTAFLLEATFLGVMLVGRDRVSPGLYFACCMVSLGTLFSAFWILANNSWMQVPVGHQIVDGKIVPSDWKTIIAGPVFLVRWLHMLLAAFLTTSMCVIATGAWYLLRSIQAPKRGRSCTGVWDWPPCWCRCSSSSDTSTADMSFTTSHRKSARSRPAGTTRSRLPRRCSPGRMRRSGETSSRSLCRRRFSLQNPSLRGGQ
jgi:cytochrome bd-type quinol oxidase subunit 1